MLLRLMKERAGKWRQSRSNWIMSLLSITESLCIFRPWNETSAVGWCAAGRRLREKNFAQYFDPWCISGSQHVCFCVCVQAYMSVCVTHTLILLKCFLGLQSPRNPNHLSTLSSFISRVWAHHFIDFCPQPLALWSLTLLPLPLLS